MRTYSPEDICPLCSQAGPYAMYATSWETGYEGNIPIYIVTQADDEECLHSGDLPITVDV